MKLKIIFSEPPHNDVIDEQSIVIRSPYTLTQEKVADERVIKKENKNEKEQVQEEIKEEEEEEKKEDVSDITYESYCAEMHDLIMHALESQNLTKGEIIESITLIGFKQPPLFDSICYALEKSSLEYAPTTNLIFNNCMFAGALYVNSIKKLMKSAQKQQGLINFQVYLDEDKKSMLSRHDEAHLASLDKVTFYRSMTSAPSLKPFIDDFLFEPTSHRRSKTSFRDDIPEEFRQKTWQSRLQNPTYYYREALRSFSNTPAELALKNFFSDASQQQNDYTCGPATLRMVANFYETMHPQRFCEAEIEHPEVWQSINKDPEIDTAAQVKTTEADGSDIPDIRDGLIKMELTVIDDDGISNKEYTDTELTAHKDMLWEKMKEILKLGIPIVLNMQDKGGCGHFEVVIGIENTPNGEQIILAEPGTALTGALEFECLSKEQFIPRWKNMDGQFHGRFVVLPPNTASTNAIEEILQGVPHCLNGKDQYRDKNQTNSL